MSIDIEIVNCFWPPAYKINLTHQEVFEIGDDDSSYEELFKPGDELIQEEDLKEFDLENDRQKFVNFHKEAARINKRNSKYATKYNEKILNTYPIKSSHYETNFDVAEPKIVWTGLVDGTNLQDKFDLKKRSINKTESNNSISSEFVSPKLENSDNSQTNTNIYDYDYYAFKSEYYEEIQTSLRLNTTYNSTNHQEEESIKNAIETIADFKRKPQNCTKEENKGIGFDAVECIWKDLNKVRSQDKRNRLFKRLWNIMMTWLLVYIFIGIPIWCQTGWFCCCLQCKFCKPHKLIIQAKGFLARNPPGTFMDTNKVIIEYKATEHEIDAFNNLDLALRNL